MGNCCTHFFPFSGDEDLEMRGKALKMIRVILKVEEYDEWVEKESGVRRKKNISPYELPLLNFNARNYSDMVKMSSALVKTAPGWTGGSVRRPYYTVWTQGAKGPPTRQRVTLPPILAVMTQQEVNSIVEAPLEVNYPCHSQTVEHGVALVSKVCKRFRTESTQNEAVLVTQTARKEQPAKRMTIARYGEEYGAFFKLDK